MGLFGGQERPNALGAHGGARELGGSWGGLGGLLGHLGVQDRAKTPKKSMPTSIEYLMPLGINIFSDFIGFRGGKWKQVGTKNRSKTYLNLK